MEWLMVKTLLSLAAVLGLMFGLLFALKRFVYRGRPAGASTVEIEILGQRVLQPKRSVYVLKVMEKVIVVGMTEHGMQALAEVEDVRCANATGEQAEPALPASRWMTWTRGSMQRGTFSEQLRNCLGSFGRKGAGR